MAIEYVIKGKYKGMAWEEIDTTDTKKDLNYLLGEYHLAYGSGWKFKTSRREVKIKGRLYYVSR